MMISILFDGVGYKSYIRFSVMVVLFSNGVTECWKSSLISSIFSYNCYIFTGGFFSSLFSGLFGTREMRILILGLDGAGKTTILYRLQVGEVVTTIPSMCLWQVYIHNFRHVMFCELICMFFLNPQQLVLMWRLWHTRTWSFKYGTSVDRQVSGKMFSFILLCIICIKKKTKLKMWCSSSPGRTGGVTTPTQMQWFMWWTAVTVTGWGSPNLSWWPCWRLVRCGFHYVTIIYIIISAFEHDLSCLSGGGAKESHPGGVCKQAGHGTGHDPYWGG